MLLRSGLIHDRARANKYISHSDSSLVLCKLSFLVFCEIDRGLMDQVSEHWLSSRQNPVVD